MMPEATACDAEYCGSLPGFRQRLFSKLVEAAGAAFRAAGAERWKMSVFGEGEEVERLFVERTAAGLEATLLRHGRHAEWTHVFSPTERVALPASKTLPWRFQLSFFAPFDLPTWCRFVESLGLDPRGFFRQRSVDDWRVAPFRSSRTFFIEAVPKTSAATRAEQQADRSRSPPQTRERGATGR